VGYEKNPTLTWGGFPLSGGDLTDTGKEQKQDHDVLRAGTQAYAQMINDGVDEKTAAHQTIRQFGAPFLTAMMLHQDNPLLRQGSFHDAVMGMAQDAGPQYKQISVGNHVYNVPQNPDGSIGTPQEVKFPGFETNQPTFDPKRVVKTDKGFGYAQDDGTIRPMTWSNGGAPGGGGVITSAGSPSAGSQVGTPLTAAQQKAADLANQPLTAYSKDPIPTAASKHPITLGQTSYLSNASNFINDLKVVRDYADTSGPVSGMVNYVGGKYLGTNAEGAEYASALNRLDQGVYAQYGIKGSAGAKQCQPTSGTGPFAPLRTGPLV
jgi:hypothetical protein